MHSSHRDLFIHLLPFLLHSFTSALPPPSSIIHQARDQFPPTSNLGAAGPRIQCIPKAILGWWPAQKNYGEPIDIANDCEGVGWSMLGMEGDFGGAIGTWTYQSANPSVYFPATTTSPSSRHALPLSYSNKICRVSVSMTKSRARDGHWKLPGLPQGGPALKVPWPDVEKVKWMEVASQVMAIQATCEGGMGYSTLGDLGGVTVTLWGKGGSWDQKSLGLLIGSGEIIKGNVTVAEGGDVSAVS